MYVSSLTTVYLTQTYDGDGRPAKRTERRVIEQESGPPEEEWITNYFLRSSVLNGAPIVDLTGYGMKEKLRVYAAGTILAEEGNLIVGGVQWRYPKPGTGSWIDSNGGGQEMDPLGADVTENPYLVYQTPSYLNLKESGERLFDEGDDPFSVGSGCSLDGMPVSCSYLNRRLDDDSVQTQYDGLYERDPNLPAGAANRFVPVTKDIRNHGLGIYEIWMPPEFRNEYSRGGWVLVPQNRAAVPLPGTDAIKNRLSTGDCNAYIASLIAKANELYGGSGNVAVAKDGLDLLSKISGQGGFVTKNFLKIDGWPVSGTVSGSIAGGTATVLISTRFMFGNSASAIFMWQADYINTAIHEMLHLSGRYSGYNDTQLATVASKLPGAAAGLPAPPKDYKDMKGILANSGYFDSELKKHCGGK
jgi:hypothetical protein